MVTIHEKEFTITYDKGHTIKAPVCRTHQLKSENHFRDGEVKSCYITEMSDGRYAVFTAGYNSGEFYKVIQDQETLHDEFEEVEVLV